MTVLDKLNETARIESHRDDELVKIVVLDRKLIWMWVPKVAGASISKALLGAYGDRAIACHIPLDLIWRLNPRYRDFPVVGFKRNPYTRVLSCWFDKIASPRAAGAAHFKKSKYAGLHHGMSFGEFTAWLNTPAGSDERADQHWVSQHLLLERATRILPYEDLEASTRSMGIARLPHKNSRSRVAERMNLEHRTVVDWYDARSYADVTRRFAKDLEVLGYDFPGEPPTA